MFVDILFICTHSVVSSSFSLTQHNKVLLIYFILKCMIDTVIHLICYKLNFICFNLHKNCTFEVMMCSWTYLHIKNFFLNFLKIYIFFYWSINTGLQCFRCTTRWFHYTYTHILFLKLLSITGYYKILAMVPFVIQ